MLLYALARLIYYVRY